jgi:hypothetical protein
LGDNPKDTFKRSLWLYRFCAAASKERLEQMAINHETIAKAIEGRMAGRVTAHYWNAPSIVPS